VDWQPETVVSRQPAVVSAATAAATDATNRCERDRGASWMAACAAVSLLEGSLIHRRSRANAHGPRRRQRSIFVQTAMIPHWRPFFWNSMGVLNWSP